MALIKVNSHKLFKNTETQRMGPEQEKFVERLVELVTKLGYPEHGRQTQLAKRYQLKQPSVRKWFTGDAMPSYAVAQDLCKRALVNYDWLMTGRGEKFIVPEAPALPPQIEHALRVMQQMAPWQVDQVVKIIDTIAEPPTQHKNGTSQ